MSTLGIVNAYLCANLLVATVAALMTALRAINSRLSRPIAYRHLLALGNSFAFAALLLPVGMLQARADFTLSAAQVWAAPAMRDHAAKVDERALDAIAFAQPGVMWSLDVVVTVAAALFVAGVLVLLLAVTVDASGALRVVRAATQLHRNKRVRIVVSDRVAVPFSWWIPGSCFIVVPASLLLHPGDLRMAVRHEAQHHRQRDTKLLYVWQALRGIFFWNPAAHVLVKQLTELQEFACDEAVTLRARWSVQRYCGCLLRVAEAATERRALLRACMARGSTGALKQRVIAALTRPKAYLSKPVVAFAGVVGISMLAAVSLAVGNPIHDRRVTMEEAQKMLAVAKRNSAFPLELNDRVLAQLNVLLGTPDGRAFVDESLERMALYQSHIAEHIVRYGLPEELLAVPLVESGYHNDAYDGNPRHGAGLWRFIEPTARNYGLRVDKQVDERLNVAAETDAAMRLLSDLHRRYDDWRLALLAYNGGNWRVEKGMRATGSNNAWDLVDAGFENDKHYLARVVASILIVKNRTIPN